MPPRDFTDSHDIIAVNTLPKCMRPDGEGAKRPRGVKFSVTIRQKYEIIRNFAVLWLSRREDAQCRDMKRESGENPEQYPLL